MVDIIKFHNLDLAIHEILPRRETILVPQKWTLVIFDITHLTDLDENKIIQYLESWLRKNTFGRYYIKFSMNVETPDTNSLKSYNRNAMIYFEDQNDAFYTKLTGLETILNDKN